MLLVPVTRRVWLSLGLAGLKRHTCSLGSDVTTVRGAILLQLRPVGHVGLCCLNEWLRSCEVLDAWIGRAH